MSNENDFLILLDPQDNQKSSKANLQTATYTKPAAARNYYKEYMILLTASQFLTTIQTISLYNDPLNEYDSSDIIELAEMWRKDVKSLTSEQMATLAHRLSEFRAKIEESDQNVQTANVRRLFEKIGTPDATSLERVIQYYFWKEHKSAADRDKIDLLVTRWGSFRVPGTERMVVLRTVRDLHQKLEKIYKELGIVADSSFDQDDVSSWINIYCESILNVKTMSELVEKNYKSKLREFKLALGDYFYNPAALSGIVEANVALHNVLQELYVSEKSRLELYVDHAKKKTGKHEAFQLPPTPISKLVTKAEEMNKILEETQKAIASHQVVDMHEQDHPDKGTNVDRLVALLEETLRQTNLLSKEIQRELSKVKDS
ncbi:MAG: hypothetical protein JNN15_14065 [Blastocatellia bacterium]|nr:hypothetical protein [Blastocatellia bacterium]